MGGKEEFRTSWICGGLCRIFGDPGKSRRAAAPPSGAEGVRFRGIPPGRPKFREIPLLGAIGRNFTPHGSVLDCVRYLPKFLKNRGGSLIRWPGGSTAKERDSGKFRQNRKKFSEIANYLGRLGGIPNLTDLRANAQKLQEIQENLGGSPILHPAVKGCDSGVSRPAGPNSEKSPP